MQVRRLTLELCRDALAFVVSAILLRFFPTFTNGCYNKLPFRWRKLCVNHGVFRAPDRPFSWSVALRNGKRLKLSVDVSSRFWTDYAFQYSINDPALKRLQEALIDNRKEKTAYLDVGANVGTSCIYALASGCDVWMFEPNSRLRPFIESLCQLNGFKPRRIEWVALSDAAGQGVLHISSSSYLSSFDKKHAVTEGDVIPITVTVRTLDSYLPELRSAYRALILKIDVEGHEIAVLQGARATIECYRPAVMIEVLLSGRRGDVFEFFTSRDYRGFAVNDNVDALDLYVVDSVSVVTCAHINFAFFPTEMDLSFAR